jgi:glycosyltransferase involved in cell wall biosynthesis
MPVKLGIGITTFNRCRKLEACISRLQKLTVQPFRLVVADDGSTDATAAICAQRELISVAGVNMGIAWNKNEWKRKRGQSVLVHFAFRPVHGL